MQPHTLKQQAVRDPSSRLFDPSPNSSRRQTLSMSRINTTHAPQHCTSTHACEQRCCSTEQASSNAGARAHRGR
eukprot:2357161-Rhodomonas_salina.1